MTQSQDLPTVLSRLKGMGPVIIRKEILDYTVQPRSRKDMFKDTLAFTEFK